jgi:hypothetical protein
VSPRLTGALALLLAAGAAAASLFVSSSIFERMPHVEDEFANLWQAEVMARGRLWIVSPPEAESFLVPFVVDHEGRRFGKYPPGWPAALSLGAAAGAPFAVNALLMALAVWWTYRLGSRLAGTGAGLLAGALAAGSPMMLMLSGSLMSHLLTVVLTLTFTSAWLDLFPERGLEPRLPAGLLVGVGGLSLGLMALTRPLTALAIALPFGIHGLSILARGGRRARARLVGVVLLVASVGGLLFAWQWAVTRNPSLNPYTLWWSYDRLGFGPGIGPMPGGHSLQLASNNTRHALNAWQHDLFGWPYVSWVLVPAGLFSLRHRRDAWLALGVFPSLVSVYLAYWVGSWLLGPRYFVEAVPALAAVSAAGAAALTGGRLASGWAARLRRVTVTVTLAGLLALNLLVYLPVRLGGLRGLYGITRARMAVLDRPDLASALIIVHPLPDWTSYGALLLLTDPFRRGSPLMLAFSQGALQDQRVAQTYSDRTLYHYYPDDPLNLYAEPRP